MKLTTERLKKLIREEIQKIKEGSDYTSAFSPDNAAIFYVDKDENSEDAKDYIKALKGIKDARERGFDRSVPYGTQEYKKMKEYYENKGFQFQQSGGTSEKVKPPNTQEFVDFVFIYVKPTKGK